MARFLVAHALLFTLVPWALGQSGGQRPIEREFFLDVAVTNKQGYWVGGLTAENFKVYRGDDLQPITSFSSKPVSLSVGILVDISGSSYGMMEPVRAAVESFVQSCEVNTEFFLVLFNTKQHLLLDSTSDKEKVLNTISTISSITPKANTSYFETLDFAIDKVSSTKNEKKALVVLSDGQDNTSKLTFEKLNRKVKGAEVIVYHLLLVDPGDAGSSYAAHGLMKAEQLSEVSGGRTFFPKDPRNADDVNKFATRIADDLRNQYRLGISANNLLVVSNPDTWKELNVKLVLPPTAKGIGKVFVQTRRGYYTKSVGGK